MMYLLIIATKLKILANTRHVEHSETSPHLSKSFILLADFSLR